MTDVKEIGEGSEPETNESRLSIVSNQGLTATTTSDSNHSSNQSRTNATSSSPKGETSSLSLDFIGTSHAVKNLFSIPYHSSDKPLCFAVHNIDGTLLIDDTVLEEEQDERNINTENEQKSLALSPFIDEFSRSEATKSQMEALSMLTNIIQQVKEQEETGKKESALHNVVSPVHEYIEWKFQGMDLLVGSDALIVRPEDKSKSPVAIRVEDVSHLQHLWEQSKNEGSTQHQQQYLLKNKLQRSYAQALLQKPSEQEEEQKSTSISSFSASNLEKVKLQTSIIPSDPLSELIDGPASAPNAESSSLTSSPKCMVLDAYLDNIMANVPSLALCLQEKGLLRSVKLMQTDDIPSRMLHPSTLDLKNPFDSVAEAEATDELFSPKMMEANASALLRFLKANCTRNNSTYLLQRDPGDGPNNIQLYDISSISAQRQRKWIWWLATMSYRFALRLRHLEWTIQDLSTMKKRAFRDRQRSLYQTTLDLLQDLFDMEGNAHESMVASVHEHMADTFLGESNKETSPPVSRRNSISRRGRSTSPTLTSQSPPPVLSSASNMLHTQLQHSNSQNQEQVDQTSKHQKYANLSIDSLNKGQDHLVNGIKVLWPVLKEYMEPRNVSNESVPNRKRGRARSPLTVEGSLDGSDRKEEPPAAMVTQLFGMYYKAVNVSLRLAEHHLRNYYSSSAMQELRHAGRRMAQLARLLKYKTDRQEWTRSLQVEYIWLWEHCGHFARSFASDDLWRERGHACGDDVISLLRDVDAAFSVQSYTECFGPSSVQDISEKTKGVVSLQSLSAVVHPFEMSEVPGRYAMKAAQDIFDNQRQLLRDKRKVLVASCISYDRAILACLDMASESEDDIPDPMVLNGLYKRLGDACNETGKLLLETLRNLLSKQGTSERSNKAAAKALLDSAQFWFNCGLESFESCGDLSNIALIRCNLCQCFKLRANSNFVTDSKKASHAETCLEEAANHLQAAHESIGQREVDPTTWDMVSDELAATFLVLGVRRRQSLLGGGNAPVFFQSLRLSPGNERGIVEPMEKALKIYEQSGNTHQAAAVHYQLALTNSKIWTCQRDEAKTREKLSAAFQHYNMAFHYFSSSLKGNEATFILLCLDIASLYATVAGEEGLTKALSRCLDTHRAFSREVIDTACNTSKSERKEFLDKMEVLADNIEDRVFKLLKSLVKNDSEKYKDLYREGLTTKITKKIEDDLNPKICKLLSLHDILLSIKTKFDAI